MRTKHLLDVKPLTSHLASCLALHMIHHLEVHRNFITWIVKKLEEEGIPCKRTRGNDSGGDILYYSPDDEPRVKQIVRDIHLKHNQP